MSKTISIKELNIDSIRPNPESLESNLGGSKITIIGKPGSGKSVLIKQLLYSKKHLIPVAMAISGSEDSNKFYEKIIPSLFIYDRYRKDVLENFIKRQKHAKEHLKNPWAVLVMDDCMDDVKIFNDPLLQGLFKNGRHWNMLAIFANQYVFDFKPNIRTNIDGVFIFREPNQSNREKIYKNFASIIPTYSIFCQLMNDLTQDYTCIYINNQIQSNEWTDCVFYFKADPNIPDFKFGCPDYLKFAEERQTDDN
jgi:hypothetical protein